MVEYVYWRSLIGWRKLFWLLIGLYWYRQELKITTTYYRRSLNCLLIGLYWYRLAKRITSIGAVFIGWRNCFALLVCLNHRTPGMLPYSLTAGG